MTTVTRTTELEAVNTILSTIGESPINSLTGTLPVDANIAQNVLDEICREVQSAGWHWNTHYKVDLSRDGDNKIPIGTDVLRVKLNTKYDRGSYDVVQRDNYLYNLAKNEETFTTNFEDTDIVYLLDFSKIPEQAKRYITIRSARVFHDRTLGATTIHKFSTQDEARALSLLRQAETETGEYSIFDSHLQSYTVNR